MLAIVEVLFFKQQKTPPFASLCHPLPHGEESTKGKIEKCFTFS